MRESNSWESFFNAHASIYDENTFTKNTVREVDFLIEELALAPGARVLDVGCGTGRHSIELAKRGYHVTGLDLSADMLGQAQAKSEEAGVRVEWIHGDATQFSFSSSFDAAICLCEGAFGLLGANDDVLAQPLAILCNMSQSLKANGRCLLTVLNGLRMIRRHAQDDVQEDGFNPLTMAEVSEYSPAPGHPPVRIRERGFVPTELVLLFGQAGLSVRNLWGGTAGTWLRQRINLDEIEIMVVAEKSAQGPLPVDAFRVPC